MQEAARCEQLADEAAPGLGTTKANETQHLAYRLVEEGRSRIERLFPHVDNPPALVQVR